MALQSRISLNPRGEKSTQTGAPYTVRGPCRALVAAGIYRPLARARAALDLDGPPPAPADYGDRRFVQVPWPLVEAMIRGDLTAAEFRIAVAVAQGQPWVTRSGFVRRPGIASRTYLRRRAGVDARTVRRALRGSQGRPRLAPYVVEVGGVFVWSDLTRWVRVTYAELENVLRRRPGLDPLRLWAWTLTKVAGPRRPFRELFDAGEAGRALGWAAGRAWRALRGGRRRLGAIAAGLVRYADHWLWAWLPRSGATDPLNPGGCGKARRQACQTAVGGRSGRSAPPHARGEIPYWQIQNGSSERISLVDLAARWLARKGQEAIEAVPMGALVAELTEHLAAIRDVWPGRRWAPAIVYLVIEAAIGGILGKGRSAGLPGRGPPD